MTVSHRPATREPPTITLMLLAAIFIVWLLSGILAGPSGFVEALIKGPGTAEALALGATGPGLVFGAGQYWRVISACFVHFGILHLAFNSWALVAFGPDLEKEFGKGRYLFIYVVSGIGGGLLSSWMNAGTVAGGASGAIFGLIGALWSALKHRRAPASAMQSIVWIIGINLALGLRPGSGIDNWAHGGGLITGLILGYLIPGRYRASAAVGRVLDAVGSVVSVGLLAYGLGFAGQNVYLRLTHPEQVPLRGAVGRTRGYFLGVPAGWAHEDDPNWDVWTGPDDMALLVRQDLTAEGKLSLSTQDAVERTRRLMQEAESGERFGPLTIGSQDLLQINGFPAIRVRVYATPQGEDPMRLTAYYLMRGNRLDTVAMLSPYDLKWADPLLDRIAPTVRP